MSAEINIYNWLTDTYKTIPGWKRKDPGLGTDGTSLLPHESQLIRGEGKRERLLLATGESGGKRMGFEELIKTVNTAKISRR